MNEKARGRHANIDKTMRSLSRGKGAPKWVYVIIVLLYLTTHFMVVRTSMSRAMITVLGSQIPLAAFTGVFSSIGNLCIMVLVVLYKKTGYITAMSILCVQFPLLIVSIVVRNSVTSIPGLFTNTLTMIASTIIFLNAVKIDKYQMNIREQAVTDRMTGLPNRFACGEYIDDLVKHGDRFAVVSVNLNNFKSINDTMGHETGDKVLIEIAKRWKALADSFSTGTNDFVARLAGDEYLIVIRDYASEEEIEDSLISYKTELERKITIDECDYYMTAQFGYAEYPTDGGSSETMIACAETAMHELKRRGTMNGLLRFDRSFVRTEKTLETERKIRHALENDTIFYHLQPQFDMDHKLRGFEALARMKDADGTIISPGEFIPIAEKTGLIDRIDIRVFDLAVGFLEDMIREYNADFMVSVNISVRHLMKNNFIDEIRNILRSHDVAPERIEIEITESIMIDSAERALNCIGEVKAMGIKIAIDDFGTGYSSLSYLNNFPADMIKIDKSFIDGMNSGEASKQYVKTIISIGHILDLDVISEGVETDDQLETLENIGCDFIQGFVWGRPVPPEEAEKIVRQPSC